MRLLQMAVAAPVLSRRFGPTSINWHARQRLAVYPDLGIVYNRIKKNANTTAVFLLHEIESGKVETEANSPKKAARIDSLSLPQTMALRNHLYFVIVRNPYSRVLSAFLNQMGLRPEYRQKYGRFPMDPSGFASFADWLADGGIKKNAHWNLQTEQMFLPFEKFDAVIRFESLKPEMSAMLDERGLKVPKGRLDGLYPSDAPGKKTSADKRIAEFYSPETINKIGRLYEQDFTALGYSHEFPS